MPDSDAERFRAEAEECRKLADVSPNPADKEAWLRLAAEWMALAAAAAVSRKRPWSE